jgi:hypothetical protein
MKPIAEYLNFMSSMGRDLLSKISLWMRTKTTSWARKSPKFSKSDDESQVCLLRVGALSGVECRTLFTVALSSPTAVGFYGQFLV